MDQEGSIDMATRTSGADWRVAPREHEEGAVTKAIEHYTSQIPSGGYLTAAVGCMAASAALHFVGRKHDALFIGQWAPAILIMGLYNKLVKVEGSD
jgi:hypothetical protein